MSFPLTGLTVNSTNGNVQVTNGTRLAEYTPAGILATPGAFYLTANPYPITLWGAPIDGLGFSLRPQSYGTPCPANGPMIGYAGGYPWAGNSGFAITQTGATPGKTSILLLSLAPLCPPLNIGSCGPGSGLWVSVPFFATIGAGIIPGSGTKSLTLPLPPPSGGALCSLPVGIGIFAQWVNFGGGLEATDALTFTIGQV